MITKRNVLVLLALLLLPVARVFATTANGNEFALYFSEATTDSARKAVLDEGMGKQHFFRYLRITDVVEGEEDGYPYLKVTTVEPSSKLIVKFIVRKSLSIAKLKEDPPSKIGDAIAVTGVVRSADKTTKTILLNPCIVRYKDRLTPKGGKEMLSERDTSAIVYSFTGGKEPVNVSLRDQDLLRYEGEITAAKGKDGWAKFLLEEIAKRDKVALAARDKLGIYRKEKDAEDGGKVAAPAANVQATNTTSSVITEDEE